MVNICAFNNYTTGTSGLPDIYTKNMRAAWKVHIRMWLNIRNLAYQTSSNKSLLQNSR